MKTKKSAKKKNQPKTRRSATKRKLTNAEWLRAGGASAETARRTKRKTRTRSPSVGSAA